MNDYLNQINPKRVTPVIKEILKEAVSLETPIIRMDSINFIIQLIKVGKIKKVLEIGTAIGYSAIMMSLFTQVDVLTIERDSLSYERAVKNIKKAELENKIQIINDDANTCQLPADYKCDLIFIDAAKASYIRFFEKYEKYLNPNGIIITDNLLFHGLLEHPEKIVSKNKKQLVKKIDRFNNFLVNNSSYDSYIYAIGDGLSVSIRKD